MYIYKYIYMYNIYIYCCIIAFKILNSPPKFSHETNGLHKYLCVLKCESERFKNFWCQYWEKIYLQKNSLFMKDVLKKKKPKTNKQTNKKRKMYSKNPETSILMSIKIIKPTFCRMCLNASCYILGKFHNCTVILMIKS